MGALSNIRVLDLSTMLAGPFGAMMLGDLGAEIIKIETPDGDGTRGFPPRTQNGTSLYYMAYNRNKKSVVINLKTPEGRQIFYDLVKQADVVWDNFRPGIIEKLGIDYNTIKAINPRIISASVTGFGSDNPYGNRPTYDLCIQAISGVLSVTGEPDRPPVKLGVPMADIGGGWYAVVGVLAALMERERTGVGQRVDVSMLDGLVSLHGYEAVYYLNTGVMPEPLGTMHRSHAPYQIFKTEDYYIAIVVALDKFWQSLCKAMELSNEVEERYATVDLRYQHRNELIELLEKVFLTKSTEYWLQKLEEADVPCGAVNRMDSALAEPALLHREMVVDVAKGSDTVKLLGNPIKLSNSTSEYTCPPDLGQDTDMVLQDILGYSPEKVRGYRDSNVVK